MDWKAGLAALAVASPTIAAPSPAATPATILTAARAAFSAQKTDRFSPAAAEPPPGRPFSVTYAIRDGDLSGDAPTTGFWTYHDGELLITVSADDTPNFPEKPQSKLLYFGGSMTAGTPYRAGNAFGATATVRVENWRKNAIALVTKPQGDLSAIVTAEDLKYLKDTSNLQDYHLALRVAGPEARRVATAVRVVVEGTTTPLPNGRLTACEDRYSEPKFPNPLEYSASVCWLGAHVTRVALIDSGMGGAVLKEWVATSEEIAVNNAPPMVGPLRNPAWVKAPGPDDLDQYIPERAQRLGVSGEADVQCVVAKDGSLSGCSSIREQPESYQFGAQALKLARLYRAPLLADGAKTEGATVIYTVRFTAPK